MYVNIQNNKFRKTPYLSKGRIVEQGNDKVELYRKKGEVSDK